MTKLPESSKRWSKWYRWNNDTTAIVFQRMENGDVFTHQSGYPTIQSDDWDVSLKSAFSSGDLIEITEAEAKARVKPVSNHLPALIPGIATDRMVDLFLSWRLPSDFQPDGGISFTSRPIHESWPTGTNLFTATQARGMIEHLLSVPKEEFSVKPAEPVDAERIPDKRPTREVIKDIMEWLDPTRLAGPNPELALDTAQQWLKDNPETTDQSPFTKPFTNPQSGMGISKRSSPNKPQQIEPPNEWVTQDRVPIRPGIDQGWWEHPGKTPSSWWDMTEDRQNAIGLKHGATEYYEGTKLVLHVQCRRQDLPTTGWPEKFAAVTTAIRESKLKIIPVKLWMTYRMLDEGGDWPVRVTNANDTCQNWIEIKTPNGFYIETDQ